MKRILHFMILTFLLTGCICSEPELNLKPPQIETYLQWRIADLKTFIDSTLTDSTDLSKFLIAKSIENRGNIKEIDFIQGIKLYNSILQTDTNNIYPIFEGIEKPFSILIIKGNGQWGDIWGKILIDKESNEIIKIEFDHRSEPPGMGANFSDSLFEKKFLHKKISFDTVLFELNNIDYSSRIAKYQIDGISGATNTCDSAIQMINKEIIRYKKYLR